MVKIGWNLQKERRELRKKCAKWEYDGDGKEFSASIISMTYRWGWVRALGRVYRYWKARCPVAAPLCGTVSFDPNQIDGGVLCISKHVWVGGCVYVYGCVLFNIFHIITGIWRKNGWERAWRLGQITSKRMRYSKIGQKLCLKREEERKQNNRIIFHFLSPTKPIIHVHIHNQSITLSFFPRYLTSIICPDTKPAASGDAIFLLSSSDTCTKPSYPGNISTNTPKLCTPLITQSLWGKEGRWEREREVGERENSIEEEG